jgi:CBS domain-containing protein
LEPRKAVQKMRDTRHHRLPVVENGNRLIGILAMDDVAFDLGLYAESFLSVAGQYSRRAREIEGALGE